MRSLSAISVNFRSLISILSIFIILLTSHAPQLYHFEDARVENMEVATTPLTNDQDPFPEQQYKLMAYQAVLPMIHANLPILQYLIFSVEKVEEDLKEEVSAYVLPFLSYFNTLFRLIISPNAP